jgi:hypothetical protein
MQRHVLILLSLLNMLLMVSDVLFLVFASLVPIRFSSASKSLVATAVLGMMSRA